MLRRKLWLWLICLIGVMPLVAQSATPEPTAIVLPDVTGLSVPAAAARLNQAGYRLGALTLADWTAAVSATPNTIRDQTPNAGTALPLGEAVNLTVWRAEKTIFIFDDNDFTLQNTSNETMSLNRISFTTPSGASFEAREWSAILRPRQCVQLWSVRTNAHKDVEGCQFIQNWLFRLSSNQHFWTGSNTEFTVIQDNMVRGQCVIAEFRCEVYLSLSEIPTDSAEYLYFAYTRDAWVIYNRAPDRFLPMPAVIVAGSPFARRNITPLSTVADLNLLAPGQCIAFWREGGARQTPIACDLVGEVTVDAANAFWNAPYEVSNRLDGQNRTCPSAISATETTLCLVPRLESAQ